MTLLYNTDEFLASLEYAGRIMALDIGRKYIGVAISDDRLKIGLPSLVLKRRKFSIDAQTLVEYCHSNDVVGIIMGDPLDPEGKANRWAQSVRSYGVNLQQSLNRSNMQHSNHGIPLPILMWNERFSSQAVRDDSLINSKRSQQKRIDAHAAAYILQNFLDMCGD